MPAVGECATANHKPQAHFRRHVGHALQTLCCRAQRLGCSVMALHLVKNCAARHCERHRSCANKTASRLQADCRRTFLETLDMRFRRCAAGLSVSGAASWPCILLRIALLHKRGAILRERYSRGGSQWRTFLETLDMRLRRCAAGLSVSGVASWPCILLRIALRPRFSAWAGSAPPSALKVDPVWEDAGDSAGEGACAAALPNFFVSAR